MDRINSVASTSSNVRILDLGCGPGIIVEALATAAKEIVAFDLTPAMIHLTRQRCQEAKLTNVLFIVGQAENIPLEDSTFDVVVTHFTFHHFSDPKPVISEIVRILRPNGRVIIAEVLSSEDAEKAKLHNALEILRDPSHVRMFSRSEFRTLLESGGLHITMEEGWTLNREFSEWIQITNAPERSEPLFTVMQNLAKAGLKSGIDLQFKEGTVVFQHHGILFIAEKKDKK